MSFGNNNHLSSISQSQVSTSVLDRHSTAIENGGLFTKEECRELAKKIIESYDVNGDGVCDTIEVAKWLMDCYRAMNRSFQPTATDIASYMQIVDRNRKGKVSVDDLQAYIVSHFFSPTRQ